MSVKNAGNYCEKRPNNRQQQVPLTAKDIRSAKNLVGNSKENIQYLNKTFDNPPPALNHMVVVSMNGASGSRLLNNSHGDVISHDKSFF